LRTPPRKREATAFSAYRRMDRPIKRLSGNSFHQIRQRTWNEISIHHVISDFLRAETFTRDLEASPPGEPRGTGRRDRASAVGDQRAAVYSPAGVRLRSRTATTVLSWRRQKSCCWRKSVVAMRRYFGSTDWRTNITVFLIILFFIPPLFLVAYKLGVVRSFCRLRARYTKRHRTSIKRPPTKRKIGLGRR
jgi:hypothetical protein